MPTVEEYVFYVGREYKVEFYFTDKGKILVKDYFDACDVQVQVKFLALVKYIAENGRIFDEKKFRLVDKKEKIYEFKPKGERFFSCFYEGKRIVVLHAYRKKSQKVSARELARAIMYKQDYELRFKEGSYYESN